MQKYQNNVLTNSGQPLAGANVLVLNYPAGTPATIYSDNGVNVAPNPLLTDFSGAFGFYAADGHYSLQISRFGVSTLTVTDILLNDDIPTDEGAGAPLTGAELQSVFQNGQWVQKSLATIAQYSTQTYQGIFSVKQFGANGDGSDQTTQLQAAYTAASAAGKTAWHPDGNYCATGLTAACGIDMSPGAQLTYIGADNGVLLNITSSNTKHGTVRVNGNAKNVTPVKVSGSGNDFAAIYSSGVTATAAGDLTLVGVGLNGNTNTVEEIRVSNMVNAGHPNVSFPQGVLAFGDQNTIGSIIFNDSRSGLVISNPITVYVNEIICRNMADNGIYQLTGTLRLGRLEYAGIEEPVVFEGTANVGEIAVIGTALGIGFQNCGDVTIGRLSVVPDASGNTAQFLWRVRSGSTACGRIDIGRVTGKFKGTTLFNMPSANGTVEFLAIGSMEVVFLYDAAVCTSPASFGDMTACLGFRWENSQITLVDVNNLNNSTIFNITAPAVTKQSYLSRLNLPTYESNLVTVSNLAIRGVSFAQALIATQGVYWRTDIGPYIVENSAATGVVDSASAAPTAGTWVRGKVLWNIAPAASGISGWVLVASGTPGTWKTFGAISA